MVHVHAGFDIAAIPIGIAAARLRGRPLIVTLHASLHHQARSELRHPVYRRRWPASLQLWGVAQADAVLTFSARTESARRATGISANRLYQLRPFLPPSDVVASDLFPALPRPRIVFIPRLSDEKGLATLIDAVALMTTPATLLVVGDGPQRGALRRRAALRGLGHAVHFTGFVSPDAVPTILRHSDVLALPSTYEELGVVVLEAMSQAVPVVASNVGGIPEIFEHERNGLLVPPRQPEPLAAALDGVLEDAVYAHRMGERGRRMMVERGPFQVDEMLAMYHRAVASRPVPVGRHLIR